MCAAFEARHAGASVLIIEAAPPHMRGGNSRHTRNVRYMHIGDAGAMVGTYRSFPTRLTVPGGARLDAGAVSAVSVRPTHRRQRPATPATAS